MQHNLSPLDPSERQSLMSLRVSMNMELPAPTQEALPISSWSNSMIIFTLLCSVTVPSDAFAVSISARRLW